MKVTKEKTENSQVFLTVEMEPAEVEVSLEESYYRLVKKASIPGFRKGKAPRAILESYIGKESLLDDALNHLLPKAYENAIKEQKIEAFAQPNIEITQTDPVVFKAVVPLPPTIKLGDYHCIQVTPEPIKLSDNDVDAVIERLRHQQATWEPVERPVDLDDLVVLDIESSVEEKPFVNRKGTQYQVLPDLSFPVPGFAEQLIGMRRDGEKEFNLQFPSDYPKGELAGKEASFKVRVTEVKQERLPELDDEFARGVDPEFKTLDLLQEKVSANLKHRAEEKARMDFEERVIEAVVGLTEVEFPPVLVEIEIDRIINRQLQQWQMDGKGLEAYLAGINKTEKELREELRPLAAKQVTQSLVLGEVAREEKVEVNDSEIDTEIEEMIKSATENKDELNKLLNNSQSRESIKQLLITRKTIQRLVEIARGSNMSTEKSQKEEPK